MELMRGGRVPPGSLSTERKWICTTFMSLLCTIFIFIIFVNMGFLSSSHPLMHHIDFPGDHQAVPISFAPQLHSPPSLPAAASIHVPRLAYAISGSRGELDQLWRTLLAVYHPLNLYVLHLDLESPATERLELASRLRKNSIFTEIGNVHVVAKANMVTYRGPTMISNILHSCAVLLRKGKDWDWFINLSASDYPLMTQDDILYTFSWLPRNLNFMEHTSRLGWKKGQRAQPIIIDPGLYSLKKSDVFWVKKGKRELPTAFKLFTGSAWMALSREFVEYCVWGWDNLPRTLLMYYANFLSASEGYFQTVICNCPHFIPTIVNHDLHYISWNVPPGQHPRSLSVDDIPGMIRSNAPFARKIKHGDPVLDIIDSELLGRKNGSFVPGGWCSGGTNCTQGDLKMLKPGPGAQRLASLPGYKDCRPACFVSNLVKFELEQNYFCHCSRCQAPTKLLNASQSNLIEVLQAIYQHNNIIY